jgi:hypothetical protein
MRTLASTFSTAEEAEAARRHLESIGITRERIILKDVAQAAPGSAAAGSGGAGAGSVFISVKVTTDQVERASEILKGGRKADPEAPAAEVEGRPLGNVQGAAARPVVAPRPLPAQETGASSVTPLGAPASAASVGEAQLWPDKDKLAARERARLSRYLIFFLLALVGAFMVGAWLGLAS